jgi:acyl dehydratase
MFYEDIQVGECRMIGSHTFTAEEIKRFASAYDPQRFHVDETAAKESHFGGLVASGWHTAAVWMKLNIRDMQRKTQERRAAGIPIAGFGPSPGFDDMKWLKPVFAGDTITFENVVVAKRESRSRPGWGLLSTRNVGRNQSGEEAFAFTAHVFVERREKTPPEGE